MTCDFFQKNLYRWQVTIPTSRDLRVAIQKRPSIPAAKHKAKPSMRAKEVSEHDFHLSRVAQEIKGGDLNRLENLQVFWLKEGNYERTKAQMGL